jgi:hypothetical protein
MNRFKVSRGSTCPGHLRACDRCGGRRVVLAFLIERSVVKAILGHLGLPTTDPPVAPARGSPQADFAPWPDDSPRAHPIKTVEAVATSQKGTSGPFRAGARYNFD